MKNKWTLISLALVLAVAIGLVRVFQRKHRGPAGTFSTVTATQGPIEESIGATGEVAPLNRVEIRPPTQGRIEKLLVDEGNVVHGGQIIAWMSSNDRVAILDAARAKGEEEYHRWEDAYRPTPIVAPLSGVIILRNVVVGQTVEPTSVIYAMSDKLIVVAQVDEADIGRVKVGMPARITLDAYPEHTVDGNVFQILQEGKNVSNVITYDVKVKLGDVPSFFRSQMTSNVNFIVQRKDQAVLVPSSAVHEGRSKEKQVLVPGPKGQPMPRDVQVGIDNGEHAEILSGLNPGDSVLIARATYTPQQGPQSSPLTFGGRPSSGGSGQKPKP